MSDHLQTSSILKVDSELGLVFGFAIISKEDGEPHFDRQGDHVPESVMLEGATDFMKSARVSTDMHARTEDGPVRDGDVVFAFPLTTDIAKSLGITTKRTGLLVAIKPSPDVLKKFADGEYTGFSIGGTAVNKPL